MWMCCCKNFVNKCCNKEVTVYRATRFGWFWFLAGPSQPSRQRRGVGVVLCHDYAHFSNKARRQRLLHWHAANNRARLPLRVALVKATWWGRGVQGSGGTHRCYAACALPQAVKSRDASWSLRFFVLVISLVPVVSALPKRQRAAQENKNADCAVKIALPQGQGIVVVQRTNQWSQCYVLLPMGKMTSLCGQKGLVRRTRGAWELFFEIERLRRAVVFENVIATAFCTN